MDTNLAVLIDFENIAAGTEKEGLGRFDVTAIMQRLVDKGRVLVARSYADWGRFSRFKQALLTANVTMYELTSHGMQDKNRADIAMVVDALELAFTKDYIDTFVIVSGDSDFTPMVLKMRELNKRVIGIGTRASTSRLLVQACDEFIFYNSIVQAKRKSRSNNRGGRGQGKRQSAYNLLVEALHGLQRENPQAPLASVVKSAMRRKSSDFSETELGYTTFAHFLESAKEAGYVSIEKDGKAGGYRVDTVKRQNDDDDDEKGSWTDPYLKDDHSAFVTPLAEQGLDPLSHPTRMQVLSLIEEVANERAKKRRKVNAQFVREDVQKRLRKTIPDLPSRSLRGIFSALMQGGLLIHRDGTAIRSGSAPFRLEKDAEGLNKALLSFYLGSLEEANADLHDVEALAELFLGERDRKRDVEEALAWLAQSQTGAPESELNDMDLDDLLVLEESPEPAETVTLEEVVEPKPAKKAPAKKAPAKKAPAKKAPAKKATTKKAPAKKATAKTEESAEAEAEEKPKRKPRSRAKPKATEPDEAAAPEDAEEAPKKRTRRRVRKKTPEETMHDGNDIDLDALLS